MTTQVETHRFQAETRELLDLMIHSLYTHKEIFLRELISNASDALDKVRFQALTESQLLGDDTELGITLEVDPEARTLEILDNGIGMTREEVMSNLGTIARSGTRRFLSEVAKGKDAAGDAPEMIGQFGVGFYSAFMVADEVVVETRKAGETVGVRWSSRGDGEYAVEDLGDGPRGTSILLKLKPKGEEEGAPDFADAMLIRRTVQRYSDFIEYPIRMELEQPPEKEGDEAKTELVTLNSMKPLWTRARNEIEEKEYNEFYKHLTHDWHDPVETIHFRAEGASEYTALLYLPEERPMDLFDPNQTQSRLSLYVKHVFVMAECEELLPSWLRFVRGLVDSSDLPLNVSRETLQHNRQIGQIRKRLVKKVLDGMSALLERDRETYAKFWASFGAVVKEGLYTDDDHREQLLEVALFQSSAGADPCTLAEYVERMPVKQTSIYYVSGADRGAVENSPHLEALKSAGFECLFFVDPVDEFALQRVTEYRSVPFVSLDRGDVDLGEEEDDKSAREELAEEHKALLESAQSSLDELVSEVRLSNRLRESPAVLVGQSGGLPPHMEKLLRNSGQPVPVQKRILELNPEHPVFGELQELYQSKGGGERFAQFVQLLHGQACLAEGNAPPDPARFAALLANWMKPTSA